MILYNEIDKKCIPLVKLFNDVGLTTQFSCQGHDNKLNNTFQIIFEDFITDDDIFNFLNMFDNLDHTPLLGNFYKWMRRRDDEIVSNWIYQIDNGKYKMNQKCANEDLEVMKKYMGDRDGK